MKQSICRLPNEMKSVGKVFRPVGVAWRYSAILIARFHSTSLTAGRSAFLSSPATAMSRKYSRGHMDVAGRSGANYHGKEGERCGRKAMQCAIRLSKLV